MILATDVLIVARTLLLEVADLSKGYLQSSGRSSADIVNRIPADADYESIDEQGETIFAEGEYRDGYLCPDCQLSEEEFNLRRGD